MLLLKVPCLLERGGTRLCSQHLGGQGRQVSELESSLIYRVSSWIARATQRNPKKSPVPHFLLFVSYFILGVVCVYRCVRHLSLWLCFCGPLSFTPADLSFSFIHSFISQTNAHGLDVCSSAAGGTSSYLVSYPAKLFSLLPLPLNASFPLS